MMLTRLRRRVVLSLVTGILGSAALVVVASNAALTSVTQSSGNTITAGDVTLTDDDLGASAFVLPALSPGNTGSRCVRVSYNGSASAAVELYAAGGGGALGPWLQLDVVEGTGGSFTSCTGFTPQSTIYTGTVADFLTRTDPATQGVGFFAPTGAGQHRTYRFTWRLNSLTPDASQGASVGLDLAWRARSATFGAPQGTGANLYGQLGIAGSPQRNTFAPLTTAATDRWTQVSPGSRSCGITAPGALWCWGQGTGSTVPARAGADTDWTRVSAGNEHRCGLRGAGTLWCWGSNDLGQLGLGTTVAAAAPTQVGSSTWLDVVSGPLHHTCGIRSDRTLWCWGSNNSQQLGLGDTTTRTAPAQVGSGADWTSVSLSSNFTCGTRAPGTLWCWGAGSRGNLGNGDTADRSVPTQEATGATNWVSVSAGGQDDGGGASRANACAVRADGTLWCWGANSRYQLGLNDLVQRPVPTQVGTGTTWAAMATEDAARFHCALQTDRSLWCWGDNDKGQFGLGDNTVRTVPTSVRGDVRAVGTNGTTLILPWPTT